MFGFAQPYIIVYALRNDLEIVRIAYYILRYNHSFAFGKNIVGCIFISVVICTTIRTCPIPYRQIFGGSIFITQYVIIYKIVLEIFSKILLIYLP